MRKLSFFRFGARDPNCDEFTLSKSFVFTTGVMTFARSWSTDPSTSAARIAFLRFDWAFKKNNSYSFFTEPRELKGTLTFSLLFGGTFIFWHWEAMLVSYLSTRLIVLPFNNLQELINLPNYLIAFRPGGSYEDDFKLSKSPLYQQAWKTKIEPYIDKYSKAPKTIALVADQRAVYASYDASM